MGVARADQQGRWPARDPTDPARTHQAQKALHEIENLRGLELKPGQREGDLAAAKKALKKHGLEHVVESKAKDAYDMMVAGEKWNELRTQHPDKFVLGDMANLESLDANVTDKWIIGGPGGTGISAAEIVLAKNRKAHVTMIGPEPPPGLIENDQFLQVLQAHADVQTAALYEKLGGIKIPPGDGRFSLVLGIKVDMPTMDAHGNVHARGKARPPNFVPEGYSAANNPLTGGAYISSIGRESQLPPIAAAFRESIEAQGGKLAMKLKFSDEGQYVGYELIARSKDGVQLRRLDVTGASSRFPPWELLEVPSEPERAGFTAEARKQLEKASDLDAPPESGNFDGGFVASATQAARYSQQLRRDRTQETKETP